MNTWSKTLARMISLVALSAVPMMSEHSAHAQIVVGEAGVPTPEFVATAEPVYYEGHAAYWYGNRWHYRDEHNAWQVYREEPPALADRRMHAPPARHFYGHRR